METIFLCNGDFETGTLQLIDMKTPGSVYILLTPTEYKPN